MSSLHESHIETLQKLFNGKELKIALLTMSSMTKSDDIYESLTIELAKVREIQTRRWSNFSRVANYVLVANLINLGSIIINAGSLEEASARAIGGLFVTGSAMITAGASEHFFTNIEIDGVKTMVKPMLGIETESNNSTPTLKL